MFECTRRRGTAARRGKGLCSVLVAAALLLSARTAAAAWTQAQELSAAGGSVAVLGSVAVVGSPNYSSGGAGTVTVYTLSGSTWAAAAQLTASDSAPGNGFGVSVALASGMLAVGSGPSSGTGHGAAYVFTQSGSAWIQAERLQNANATASDSFGASVTTDGTVVLVGAPSLANSQAGAVYVFAAAGGGQQAMLTALSPAAGDRFGMAMALSGTTAVIGAPGPSSAPGAAYVFSRSGTLWSQQAALRPSNGIAGDQFGTAVALSGTTAVIGAPIRSAAYLFAATGSSWLQNQELTGSSGARFGAAVGFGGSNLLVGAPYETVGANALQGTAHYYAASNGTWSQQQLLTAADGAANGQFGSAVSVNGSTSVIGRSVGTAGAAYVFAASGTSAPATGTFTAWLALALLGVGLAEAMRRRGSRAT